MPLDLGADELREVLRGSVLAASVSLQHVLVREDWERDLDLWAMDENEARRIADPLARLAHRHSGGAIVDRDVNDLMRAGAAAAGYVLRNATKAIRVRLNVRRAQRAIAQRNKPTEQETEQ